MRCVRASSVHVSRSVRDVHLTAPFVHFLCVSRSTRFTIKSEQEINTRQRRRCLSFFIIICQSHLCSLIFMSLLNTADNRHIHTHNRNNRGFYFPNDTERLMIRKQSQTTQDHYRTVNVSSGCNVCCLSVLFNHRLTNQMNTVCMPHLPPLCVSSSAELLLPVDSES